MKKEPPIFEPKVCAESVRTGIPKELLSTDRPGGIYTVRELARGVRHDEMQLGRKYLDLCQAIRDEQMTPRCVGWILTQEGFRKSRISEIMRVCQCSPEVWEQFKARVIGFKAALDRARIEGKGEVKGDAERVLKWNQVLTAFDRFCGKWSPVGHSHIASQRVLLTWKFSEVKAGKPKTFSFHGWRVTVERDEPKDPKPAEQKAQHDKERSN